MYELIVESEFSAAHRLREYAGACENLHGHNWRVEVVIGGEELGPLGMLMDFRDVKRTLHDVLDRLDHAYLNDLPEFETQNPTTENIARIVYRACAEKVPPRVRVRSVAIWESSGAGARYSEPMGGVA